MELQDDILKFIEFSDSISDDNDFQNLIDSMEKTKITENQEELEHFLYLVINISNNHNRQQNFIEKIKQILLHLEKDIKQSLTNSNIFKIFQSNKAILLFLVKRNILKFDKTIVDEIIKNQHQKYLYYCHFFLPEIKEFIDEERKEKIESELNYIYSVDLQNFEENRENGENESYICSLIRQDSIIEFVSYVNRINLSFLSKIKSSIYETNSFLIGKNPSLIEYAAFFGSIQIFQYLRLNGVELNSSLWLYVIHSNNAELIHLLEENNVIPENNNYQKCFDESIKCHHNDIANYIENRYLIIQNNTNSNYQLIFDENIVWLIYHYCNYSYFPEYFCKNFGFFYLNKYKYNKVVELYIQEKRNEIETEIIIK